MTKSRHLIRPRHRWTEAQIQVLRDRYPDAVTEILAAELGLPPTIVYNKAMALGIRKSEAFNALPASGRLLKNNRRGAGGWFAKGGVPANKGLRRPGWHSGRMRETQFKPRAAHESVNYLPIGTLRVNPDGYLERKLTDDPAIFPTRRWTAVHRLVWMEVNGDVPPGHVVVFLPGRRTTEEALITIAAVELVTRQELMRRNSYHTRYPKEIGLLIQARGQLVRQINKRKKNEEPA